MRQNKRNLQQKELGFGQTSVKQVRVINSDGTYNYTKTGLPWWERFNLYHYVIHVSWPKFFLLILLWYLSINLFFASLYYIFGTENLGGMIYEDKIHRFWEIFFFSAQTLTTVGYGRVNPTGLSANIIATSELLTGMLNFAVITGILYGRFAKPRTGIRFSDKALVAPFQDIRGIMFRCINVHDSNLMNARVQVSIGLTVTDDQGQEKRNFLVVKLERDEIAFFVSSWTLVHPIDEDSPFYQMSNEEIMASRPELFVLLTAYDDTFNASIHARRSYTSDEMIIGGKFTLMTSVDEVGQPHVDVSMLDDYKIVSIPER